MTERPSSAPEQDQIAPETAEHASYRQIAARRDFAELRHRYIWFAFPATAVFMIWYIAYVACNNWARGVLATPVVGHINLAVIFGLLQFLSTFVIAFLYSRHSTKVLDPLATKLRNRYNSDVAAK